jgi:hypothetical protein
MYNTLIYFCNIDIKHLQHTFETSETLETYAFSTMSPCCLDELRLVISQKLDTGAEIDAGAEWGGRVQHVGRVQCPR